MPLPEKQDPPTPDLTQRVHEAAHLISALPPAELPLLHRHLRRYRRRPYRFTYPLLSGPLAVALAATAAHAPAAFLTLFHALFIVTGALVLYIIFRRPPINPRAVVPHLRLALFAALPFATIAFAPTAAPKPITAILALTYTALLSMFYTAILHLTAALL